MAITDVSCESGDGGKSKTRHLNIYVYKVAMMSATQKSGDDVINHQKWQLALIN